MPSSPDQIASSPNIQIYPPKKDGTKRKLPQCSYPNALRARTEARTNKQSETQEARANEQSETQENRIETDLINQFKNNFKEKYNSDEAFRAFCDSTSNSTDALITQEDRDRMKCLITKVPPRYQAKMKHSLDAQVSQETSKKESPALHFEGDTSQTQHKSSSSDLLRDAKLLMNYVSHLLDRVNEIDTIVKKFTIKYQAKNYFSLVILLNKILQSWRNLSKKTPLDFIRSFQRLKERLQSHMTRQATYKKIFEPDLKDQESPTATKNETVQDEWPQLLPLDHQPWITYLPGCDLQYFKTPTEVSAAMAAANLLLDFAAQPTEVIAAMAAPKLLLDFAGQSSQLEVLI